MKKNFITTNGDRQLCNSKALKKSRNVPTKPRPLKFSNYIDKEGEDDIVWLANMSTVELFNNNKMSIVLRSVNSSLNRLQNSCGKQDYQYVISEDDVETILKQISGRFEKKIDAKIGKM